MKMVRLIQMVAFVVAVYVPMLSQNDTILPNPKLVKLRRIWLQMGNYVEGGDNVGECAGSVGFVDSDSLEDFAVYFPNHFQWRIYRGKSPAPDTGAFQSADPYQFPA